MKKRIIGWNLFLSHSEAQDKIAKKNGWGFLGYAKHYTGVEIRVYRMWKMKDGPPDPAKRKMKR